MKYHGERILSGIDTVGRVVPRRSLRSLLRDGPRLFVGIGCLLFLAGNAHFLIFHAREPDSTLLGLVNLAFYAALSGIVVVCGGSLARSDISPDRYPRALFWAGSLPVALLLLNVPAMYILSNEASLELSGWALSLVTIACAAGAVVGVVEARSIERVQTDQRLRSEREANEHHAEQLEYLNAVLRHEVLNNVSIIRGYTENALERNQTDRAADLEVIHRQSEEMTNVVTDIRVLLETLQGTYTLEDRDLAAVLTDELASVRTKTRDAIVVAATIPDDITVTADPLLSRVFRNLLSNAVEHNDSPTPRIEVTVRERATAVVVRIADNGPGIPAAERETLFERPDRGDEGRGLYLARELLDRYDGRIELAETGPEGSEFTVTLNRPVEAARGNDGSQTAARPSVAAGGTTTEVCSD